LYCVMASMPLSFHAAADDKLPSDADLRAAQKTIKSTFGDDYRESSPVGQKKLIAKLVRQASDSANDQALQYALLLEVSNLAAEESDLSTVALVADELDRRYPTSAITVRASLLDTAVREAKGADRGGDLADEYLALSDAAGWAGNFQAAQHASRAGRQRDRTGGTVPRPQCRRRSVIPNTRQSRQRVRGRVLSMRRQA
jgi:hypothetical protein